MSKILIIFQTKMQLHFGFYTTTSILFRNEMRRYYTYLLPRNKNNDHHIDLGSYMFDIFLEIKCKKKRSKTCNKLDLPGFAE